MDSTARGPVAGRALRFLPALAWASLIFWLSSLGEPPAPGHVRDVPGWSQAAHFAEYLVLGLLVLWALLGERGLDVRRAGYLALAAGALYAFSDELHQHFVPGREADPGDFLADIAGFCAGALLLLAWRERRDKT